ncbi:MAG: hypothetical protein GWO24_30680, partial [Akkermansiaceae bacterium]|nr:hypothetical protein [Akkermansiaceae bacterium]
HDAFRRNLLTRDRPGEEPETVAIDWQIVGTGAIGEELAPLVGVSLQFFEFDIDRAADLDEAAFGAYLQGLEDAGWSGDPRAVRL